MQVSGQPPSGRALGAVEVTGTPGSPGDLLQWWGQAGQVEGPGAAVAADELPAVPARGTLVVVLLAQVDTVLRGVGRAAPPPHSPQNSPSAAPQGVPEPLRPLLAGPGTPPCSLLHTWWLCPPVGL